MKRSKTLAVLAVGVLALLPVVGSAAPAAADPVPDTFVIGGVNTEVPLSCARTGTGVVGENAHYTKVALSYRPSAAELSCAQKVLALAKRQVRWEFGPNGRVLEQLGAAIFSGWPSLSDPYQVFLNNLYLDATSLENLSPIPLNLPTTAETATGLGSCYVTHRYLLIHCKDDLNGFRPVRDQDGYLQYDFDAQGNLTIPRRLALNGGLSALGGTTYGSVFMENEGGAAWDMRTYANPNQGNDLIAPPEQIEHHEQVHTQQWAKHGWNFGTAYLSAGATAIGEAWWFNLWNPYAKRVDGCFNVFERDAHWRYGGYGRSPSWGYQSCPTQAAHTP